MQSNSAPRAQRASIACEPCRQKRTRCDGAEPTCGRCREKCLQCTYSHQENKRRPPSKRYIEALHARIRCLEDQLEQVTRQPVTAMLSAGREEQDAAEDTNVEQPQRNTAKASPAEDKSTESRQQHSRAHHHVGRNANKDLLEEGYEGARVDDAEFGHGEELDETHSPQHAVVDQIADTFGRLKVDEDGQVRFFGGQSNLHLVPDPASTVQLQGHLYGSYSAAEDAALFAGVPPDLQLHLIDIYFQWQNPWIYVVDRDAFMLDFHSGERGRYCTNILLLAIFAVAARFSDRIEVRADPQNPDTAGNVFAERAKSLLARELEFASIATVQAATILSIRWMAENKEPAGWIYIGIATRIAFNLGLNLDSTSLLDAGIITAMEFNVRRVTWWGCYTLDKLFVLGLGRTATTTMAHITCPKPDLNARAEFEPWTSIVPEHGPKFGVHARIASTAHYLSEHLMIASSALDVIYAPNHGRSEQELQLLVSETDLAMESSMTSLPSFLRIGDAHKPTSLPHIYQLHIQYHVAQILLHRPFVAMRAWQRRASVTEHDRAAKDFHWIRCRESAAKITKCVQHYEQQYTLRMITVGMISHTFTAAVIHLVEALSDDPTIQRQGIQRLRVCTSALKKMGKTWSWGLRVWQALQSLAKSWFVNDDLLDSSRQRVFEALSCEPGLAEPADRAAISLGGNGQSGLDSYGILDFEESINFANSVMADLFADADQSDLSFLLSQDNQDTTQIDDLLGWS